MQLFIWAQDLHRVAGIKSSPLLNSIRKYLNEILNKYPYATDKKIKKEHVWIIVGPVFSDSPQQIQRPNGTTISIPDAFYCILIRPRNYPFDSPGNSEYLTFIFPQNIERNQKIDSKYMTSINHLEQLTQYLKPYILHYLHQKQIYCKFLHLIR